MLCMLQVEYPRENSFHEVSLRLPSMIPGCADHCRHIFLDFTMYRSGGVDGAGITISHFSPNNAY